MLRLRLRLLLLLVWLILLLWCLCTAVETLLLVVWRSPESALGIASSTTTAAAMTDMQGGHFRHNATEAPRSERVLPLFSLKGKTAIVSGAGAGIGLAIVKQLIEGGGGRVGAESGDGSTRFWFSLPA